MIANKKLLRDIEKEEEVIEKYNKRFPMYQHRIFITDIHCLTEEERHVLNILQRKSDSLKEVLRNGKNKYDLRYGVNMNDFYFHLIALIEENKLWNANMSSNASRILLKHMPIKVMFILIFLYIDEHGVDNYIREIYDSPFRANQTGVILPDVTDIFTYYGDSIFKFGKKHEKFNRFNELAVRLLQKDFISISDAVRSTYIFRDNWEDIMEKGIKIPITLEMIVDAVKAQY